MVNACTGAANLAGSLLVSFCHPPKNRVRVICNSLLIAMCTENFFLAFGRTALGLVRRRHSGLDLHSIYECEHGRAVPFTDPLTMQGRVYSARNTLQFSPYRWDTYSADCWWTGCLNRSWHRSSQKSSGGDVWNRKGLRSGGAVLPAGYSGRDYLSRLSKRSTYMGTGK